MAGFFSLGLVGLIVLAGSPAAWAAQAPEGSDPLAPPAGATAHLEAVAAGNVAFEAADYEAAIAAYHLISPLEIPGYARNRLALSYHLLNRLREAQALYRLGISRDAEPAALYNNLGALYYAQQDFRNAEEHFRNALRRDPDSRTIQQNLRSARHARENSRAVRPLAEAQREANPLLMTSLVGDIIAVAFLMEPARAAEAADLERRGDAFLTRRLFEDAIIEYGRAADVDRYNAFLLNKLGLAYHQNQEIGRAENAYRDALRLNPYYVPALNNLGSIEQAKRNYERALRYYQQALDVQPNSPTVLQNVGSCLFAMERWDAGLAFYLQALRIDPNLFDQSGGGFGTLVQTAQRNESMVNLYMAKLFAETGDLDRTMSYLYRAVEEGLEDPALLDDPAFTILREDERFVQLRASLGV